MLRVARGLTGTTASGEELVQETWMAVIKGLDGFQGRSSLKGWVYSILKNKARTTARRDARVTPFSALGPEEADRPVASERYTAGGSWAQPIGTWEVDSPESLLLAQEGQAVVQRALEALPERQRIVVVMRDGEGLSAHEVAAVLELSEANVRVLLHRGRSRVRRALAEHLLGER